MTKTIMLEEPNLEEGKIITCLQDEFGLQADQVVFLPLGADLNTAVYRAVADDETPCFVKLRRDTFDETSVALPKFFGDQGIVQIIPPITTKTGSLWTSLEDNFCVIVYPFIEGQDVYDANLTDRQWIDFGAALKRIHTAAVPSALTQRIRRETYTPRWREIVRMFMGRIEDDVFDEPVAVKLATYLRTKRDEILNLVARADQLAQALTVQPREFIVCHSDIHAGNILIGADGAFYIVDWDDPILAPKERDLMYVGGGQMNNWRTPQEEEALFYQGYGQTEVDATALAYYRYERIVEDIAIYCEQIFLSDEGGQDREQSFRYLVSNFLPNGVLEIAYRANDAPS